MNHSKMKIKTKALVVCQPTSIFPIPIFKMIVCCYYMFGAAANELKNAIKFEKSCKVINAFLYWLIILNFPLVFLRFFLITRVGQMVNIGSFSRG